MRRCLLFFQFRRRALSEGLAVSPGGIPDMSPGYNRGDFSHPEPTLARTEAPLAERIRGTGVACLCAWRHHIAGIYIRTRAQPSATRYSATARQSIHHAAPCLVGASGLPRGPTGKCPSVTGSGSRNRARVRHAALAHRPPAREPETARLSAAGFGSKPASLEA
eukprot:scaffold16027_cov106-Isochrysis_galbana.AAC.1